MTNIFFVFVCPKEKPVPIIWITRNQNIHLFFIFLNISLLFIKPDHVTPRASQYKVEVLCQIRRDGCAVGLFLYLPCTISISRFYWKIYVPYLSLWCIIYKGPLKSRRPICCKIDPVTV